MQQMQQFENRIFRQLLSTTGMLMTVLLFTLVINVGVAQSVALPLNITVTDSDGDGVLNGLDAFPNDPAASVDVDGDGFPDAWNVISRSSVATKEHSTSVPALMLDLFPGNAAQAGDHDGDGVDSVDDLFPNDIAASVDADSDGFPDLWTTGQSGATSTSVPALMLDLSVGNFLLAGDHDGDGVDSVMDAFPNDIAASVDTDADGFPDAWHAGYTANPSAATGLWLDLAAVDAYTGGVTSGVAPNVVKETFPYTGVLQLGWTRPLGFEGGWNIATDSVTEGVMSLKSSAIVNNQVAAIEVTANGVGGSVLFDYRVSSEANYDFLIFYIDGVEKGRWAGDSGWVIDASFVVTAGLHTYKWAYAKDTVDINNVFLDSAWIDNVRMPVDTDGDGVIDALDAFPHDAAVSVDTDGDGLPDDWNAGATQAQIIASAYNNNLDPDDDGDGFNDPVDPANPAINLINLADPLTNEDAFPLDPAAHTDRDKDGDPDGWNVSATALQINASALHVDVFPSDPSASLDADSDGDPDYWHTDANGNIVVTTSGLHLDKFPNDPATSLDSDNDGYPDGCHAVGSGRAPFALSQAAYDACLLVADQFLNNPRGGIDSDLDGIGDSWELRYFHDLTTANGLTNFNAAVDTKTDKTHFNDGTFPGSKASIAAGGYHSLTQISNGTVVGWGRNLQGQTSIPVTLVDVYMVAGGLNHSLALKADGTVVAWGDNALGQSTVPAGLTGVIAIAAGDYHSLALKSDGTVVVWGYDAQTQVSGIPAALTNATVVVTAIAAGAEHSLALDNTGKVWAWGSDAQGQVAGAAAYITGVTAIAAGGFHSLALQNGGVVAWGSNAQGQVAGATAYTTGVTAIAAGGLHSLALKSDGTVVAWGYNLSGQSTVPATLGNALDPNFVIVTDITAGAAHSMVLDSNGTVVVWGDNSAGQSTVPGTLTSLYDADGDGVPDALDAFPTDPTEWLDSDADGVGDNADAFPNDAAASVDADGDLLPDSWNAGATAAQIAASSLVLDAFPTDRRHGADSDNDGLPDSWEILYVGDLLTLVSAFTDNDGDGVTEIDELNDGSDPTLPENTKFEAQRRLPPMIESLVMSETMSAAANPHAISFTVGGYDDGYNIVMAMFDCTGIVDGTCGNSYNATNRFLSQSLPATPTGIGAGHWSYGLEVSNLFSYTTNISLPVVSTSGAVWDAAGTTVVVRFYQVNARDLGAGKNTISLLIPGGLTYSGGTVPLAYYDNTGRRIQVKITP